MPGTSALKETNTPVAFTDQHPEPGSVAELMLFKKLQEHFTQQFLNVFF